jgi:hypothetical protein
MEQAPSACVQSHLKVVLNSEARTTTVSWEDKADTPVCMLFVSLSGGALV